MRDRSTRRDNRGLHGVTNNATRHVSPLGSGRDFATEPRTDRRAAIAWCMFDWANSPYPTVIVSFVFATYFAESVAETPEQGQSLWALAIAASGVVMALLAPFIGAIADQAGPRKPWLAAFSAIAIICGASLWFVLPSPNYIVMALVLAALCNMAYEFGQMFYNAMLPDLAPPNRLGRLSGLGWAAGYGGTLACIILATVIFVWPDQLPFGFDRALGEDARIFGPVVALWYALFALPLFLFTPDVTVRRKDLASATRDGWANLRRTLVEVRRYRGIMIFLLARMFYIDGLVALFALGPIFAVGVHQLSFDGVMAFAIALNVSAGVGAIAFGWVDDRIGPKPTIMIALTAIIVLGAVVVAAESTLLFFIAGTAAGFFGGPIQSASRSMMAHLAPSDMRVEMFGLFALSGRATAFVGPALIGWLTFASGSQRLGLSVVLVFFIVGLALMFLAPAPGRGQFPDS